MYKKTMEYIHGYMLYPSFTAYEVSWRARTERVILSF